jgi:hypothetical protein
MEESIQQKLLAEISENKGCPVCSLVNDYEFDLLAKLQYKITREKKVRSEIALHRGFCGFHFRRFKKISNWKTKIFLLKDLIEINDFNVLEFLPDCCICSSIGKYEEEILPFAINLLKKEEFKQQFAKTLGLCYPHLNMMKKMINSEELISWLTRANEKQIKRTLKDLNEMAVIKSYYEIDFEKRELVNSLIEKLAGRETKGL